MKKMNVVLIALLVLYGGAFFLRLFVLQKTTPSHKQTKQAIIPTSPVPLKPNQRIHVPILIYHYVEYVKDKKDTIRESLNIHPAAFDAQIKTLHDNGYTFLTATELADIFDGIRPLPPKPVLLTIDDGHWDLSTDILPILQKYQVKATAYIVPGFIGSSDFLSKEQLQRVIASGLVEIGSHTMHHVGLAGMKEARVSYEIEMSRTVLQREYHVSASTFAYPGGSFDQQAVTDVQHAGYRLAMSTIEGSIQSQTNRFILYRIHPGYRTGEQLLSYLQKGQSLAKH